MRYQRVLIWKSVFSQQQVQFGPKFQVEVIAPHQPFLSENYIDEWSLMWYKNMGTSFFSFVTIHTFERQTDRNALQYHALH